MIKRISIWKLIAVCAVAVVCFSYPVSAVESASDEAVAAYNQGLQYSNQGDFENALKSFSSAVYYDPEFTDAYYNIASIYEHAGDYPTALQAYEEVVSLNPEDYEAISRIADIYYIMSMDKEALECLNSIPEGTKEHAEAQNLKNKILKIQKDKAAAEKKVAQAEKQTQQVQQAQTTDKVATHPMDVTRTPSGGYVDKTKTLVSKYNSPTGIAKDSAGNVYVSSFADNAVYKVNPNGINKLFSKNTMIDGPIGLACDSLGNLYVANYNKDNILKITQSGNVSIYKTGVLKPYSLLYHNNSLYVSEQASNSVVKFRL